MAWCNHLLRDVAFLYSVAHVFGLGKVGQIQQVSAQVLRTGEGKGSWSQLEPPQKEPMVK